MPSPRREIHEKLIDILKTITIGNGHHQDVAAVTKRLKEIEMVSSFPELSLIEGEQIFELASEEEEAYEVTASFAVVGYVRADNDTGDQGLLSGAADDLLDDIKEALLGNAGSLVSSTLAKSLRIVSDEPVFDYQNNWGWVTVNFSVVYYWGGEE